VVVEPRELQAADTLGGVVLDRGPKPSSPRGLPSFGRTPGACEATRHSKRPVSYDDQRARWAALRADQDLLDRTAARLRHETAQDQYAGLRDPQVAFGFAAILTSAKAVGRETPGVQFAGRRPALPAGSGQPEGRCGPTSHCMIADVA
jgi:hypothetical protein